MNALDDVVTEAVESAAATTAEAAATASANEEQEAEAAAAAPAARPVVETLRALAGDVDVRPGDASAREQLARSANSVARQHLSRVRLIARAARPPAAAAPAIGFFC